jgi:hypothetical protein
MGRKTEEERGREEQQRKRRRLEAERGKVRNILGLSMPSIVRCY